MLVFVGLHVELTQVTAILSNTASVLFLELLNQLFLGIFQELKSLLSYSPKTVPVPKPPHSLSSIKK